MKTGRVGLRPKPQAAPARFGTQLVARASVNDLVRRFATYMHPTLRRPSSIPGVRMVFARRPDGGRWTLLPYCPSARHPKNDARRTLHFQFTSVTRSLSTRLLKIQHHGGLHGVESGPDCERFRNQEALRS